MELDKKIFSLNSSRAVKGPFFGTDNIINHSCYQSRI